MNLPGFIPTALLALEQAEAMGNGLWTEPGSSHEVSASADGSSLAVLMARRGSEMMLGTSGRCSRDLFVYWGRTQALQVKIEKLRCRWTVCQTHWWVTVEKEGALRIPGGI